MKNVIGNRNYWIFVFCACYLSFGLTFAGPAKNNDIKMPISGEWGQPEFNQYTAINKTSEWRYTRPNATLIITKSECPKCNPVTQTDVDEYNNQKDASLSAMLISHGGQPAMYRLYKSPKGVNFRVIQFNLSNFQYEIQLGTDIAASHEYSFQLENEFIKMVAQFEP